jgi:uncharacterized protein
MKTGLFSRFAPRQLDENLNRSLDRQVKLAVTGLSRSGKTVFITSLVHQLLHASEANMSQLPFFRIANNGRLRGVKAMQQPDLHIPAFRYDQAISQLCSQTPVWPTPTSGISEIRLAIRYRSDNLFFKHVAPISTLYLDIVDYPGEWLLDLPLLEWSYEQWSQQILEACQHEPRRSLSQEWQALIRSLVLDKPPTGDSVRQASALYTAFLHRCKSPEYGLNGLQPGRFTMPGDLEGAPLLEFCPLPPLSGRYTENSLYGIMRKRYDSYKEHVVKKFYNEHFASFDRQVVLIDILRALNIGNAAFEDTRSAINMILNSFHYGKSGLLSWLWGFKIDRLLFAATKADHATPEQLPNMEKFLQNMLAKSQQHATFEGVQTQTMALASVKCTQAAEANYQGRKIPCIKGVPMSGQQAVALFPGEVPIEMPIAEDWSKDRFQFMEFKPPRLANVHGGLPHIRLDRALEFLLGDKF